MEIYSQPEDLTVFGIHVKNFPDGITEVFSGLMEVFGNNRAYFGISWCDKNNTIQYYAMVQEAYKGEALEYKYERLTIGKGDYQTETIHDWLSKKDCIKDVFHQLMPGNSPDKDHPCIEWYKSEEEMLCMVKPKSISKFLVH
jgi:hypothetical protein